MWRHVSEAGKSTRARFLEMCENQPPKQVLLWESFCRVKQCVVCSREPGLKQTKTFSFYFARHYTFQMRSVSSCALKALLS